MYQANEKRYETMKYHRCGTSGLMLRNSLWDYGIILEILASMKI